MKNALIYIIGLTLLISCTPKRKFQKGFQVNTSGEN